jgi:hypothetical protein
LYSSPTASGCRKNYDSLRLFHLNLPVDDANPPLLGGHGDKAAITERRTELETTLAGLLPGGGATNSKNAWAGCAGVRLSSKSADTADWRSRRKKTHKSDGRVDKKNVRE